MLRKVKHLLQRFGACSREYEGHRKQFGAKVAKLKFWDALIPLGKSKAYIEGLSDFMTTELEPIAKRYRQGTWKPGEPKQELEKIPVWVCWWQGEEKMPPMVKACVTRLRRSLPDTAELHIVTWDNYTQYVDIPEHVLEKNKNGIIGLAHLSDVLRFALLRSYGGAWVDSTVYISGSFPEKMLTEVFYTQRFASWDACPQEACRGKWCDFFFGGKRHSAIFSFMYEALCYYWSRHDKVVDYVFFDYILWTAYCQIPEIREQIDAVPANNENIWLLLKAIDRPYEQAVYDAIISENAFFKLTYKGRPDVTPGDGRKTIYGHILEENGVK